MVTMVMCSFNGNHVPLCNHNILWLVLAVFQTSPELVSVSVWWSRFKIFFICHSYKDSLVSAHENSRVKLFRQNIYHHGTQTHKTRMSTTIYSEIWPEELRFFRFLVEHDMFENELHQVCLQSSSSGSFLSRFSSSMSSLSRSYCPGLSCPCLSHPGLLHLGLSCPGLLVHVFLIQVFFI